MDQLFVFSCFCVLNSSDLWIFFIKVEEESDNEYQTESMEEDDAYGGDDTLDDTLDDIEFTASTSRTQRSASKRNWITPRLCSALDKAKVKRMRSKK